MISCNSKMDGCECCPFCKLWLLKFQEGGWNCKLYFLRLVGKQISVWDGLQKNPHCLQVYWTWQIFFSLCFFHNHWFSFFFSFSPLHCFSAMKSPVFYFLKLILFLCDAYNCITDSSRSEDTAVPQQVVLLLEAVCSKQTSCDTQLCLLSPVHLNEGHSLLPWVFCTQLEC